MSKRTDNSHTDRAGRQPCCRIAYILDDRQPVLCSLISDQPLFYMDFGDEEDFIEEDDGFFDFTTIESGIQTLEEKIDRLCGYAGYEVGEKSSEEESFAAFLENAYAITGNRDKTEIPDIADLEKDLRTSRLAAAFLDFAANYGTKMIYDTQVRDAQYNRNTATIHINPDLSREDRILLASRELRRVWQHRRGALVNPLAFQPEQAILVHRAQIADLSVMMVRIAWELQLAGEKTVWERLENSPMEDLCRSFARESCLDFRTLNNGIAQSAVFESWFLSERCRAEDKNLIQMMLADYKGYVFGEGQEGLNVTAELIAALGEMPFGKNYLSPYLSTIMNDAIFTEVRDRSNANFLWFIKFERSFRETEQELQTGMETSGTGNQPGHINNKNIRFGDHEKTSNIIPLPVGRAGPPSSETRCAGPGGTVIQFRRPGKV